MEPTFKFDADSYFAGLRKAGVPLTAEQEAIARKTINEENTGGDIYTMLVNAIMSAWRAVTAFLGGDSSQSIGDQLSTALNNGQQRGDMHTAAEVAHRIRNKLISRGIPAETAALMTGDTTNQPEIAGNLYRVFSDQKGITAENRAAEAKYQAADPTMSGLPITTTRLPVQDNPTVTAQNLPAATNQTLALT